ncbi:DUF2795 domain-containing protein [Streptomyces sp. AJS327]|uniref:DUF2795 domain-containing protein n=1 Tax=Streptomyces sp. AJS327 TaxID=2545265 RepID=UPI0015E03E4C|nr:DUF2795 domain-containing protein [Streptomyces sp. AJS327]MBA0052198.1 DUF2795 domain-containing protein [Streptomyces sp. AJS327]
MQRGSNRLSQQRDDEAKRELEGHLRSGHPTRAEEWDDVEPGADDDPELTERPVPPAGAPTLQESEDEALRSDLARQLGGRHAFPSDREGLERTLRDRYAPDQMVGVVHELPSGHTYQNVQEVMAALGREPRA